MSKTRAPSLTPAILHLFKIVGSPLLYRSCFSEWVIQYFYLHPSAWLQLKIILFSLFLIR